MYQTRTRILHMSNQINETVVDIFHYFNSYFYTYNHLRQQRGVRLTH
jgi:hypothetical protein